MRSHVDGHLLERRLDGAGGHRLLGEQVGGAHEHADLGAPGRRAVAAAAAAMAAERASWMPPAKRTWRCSGSGTVEQALDLGVPEGEARPGADVAAALAALEHELAGAVLEEAVEQAGRGHVEVGGDAGRLERRGLRRAGRRR